MRARGWLVVVACFALAGCTQSAATPAASPAPALHGTVPEQRPLRPAFTLTDTSGATYDFRARTAGRVTILYFGYTHCPDECPTTMADIATALRRLPADVARQVTVVFVTTDPQRDTRSVLRTWLDRFNPSYVGLTGAPAEVQAAERSVGVVPAVRESAAPSDHVGQYAVSHFAAALVYGRDDRVAALYPSGVTPGDYAADLPVLVKGRTTS